jgi:hypothetical protein
MARHHLSKSGSCLTAGEAIGFLVGRCASSFRSPISGCGERYGDGITGTERFGVLLGRGNTVRSDNSIRSQQPSEVDFVESRASRLGYTAEVAPAQQAYASFVRSMM